jgi:Domain of unknown function (DUF4296)
MMMAEMKCSGKTAGRRLLYGLLIFAAAVVFASCRQSNGPGVDIIEKEKMMTVLADVAKAEELVTNRTTRDTSLVYKDEVMLQYKRVFAKNGVTRQQFFKSIQYYLSKPYLAKDMFDSLQAQTRRNAYDRMPAPAQTN